MKLIVRELCLPLNYKERALKEQAAQRLGIPIRQIIALEILRKSVDARRNRVHFRFTVGLEVSEDAALKPATWQQNQVALWQEVEEEPLIPGAQPLKTPPVIVGSGPAGLFCSLLLARQGYRPRLIERGQDIDRRIASVENFQTTRCLNLDSNVQFGEGGAGSFSDGKLTTRIGDARVNQVLRILVEHGAEPEILYQKKAHVGTDYIRRVVKEIRRSIIRLGGTVHFDTRLTDIDIHQRQLRGIGINQEQEWECQVVVLAIGHSARDTYRLLERKGIELTPKACAVGLRVEHPQELIDQIQYGRDAGHPRLPPADYHFSHQEQGLGRSLYTFCMCPGGYVIASASGEEQAVTNGMSFFARDSGVANSAVLVTVGPRDWPQSPLGGIIWQEELERKAFYLGGGDYSAPAQRVEDFIADRLSSSEELAAAIATYRPGFNSADLSRLFPAELTTVIRRGMQAWNSRMPGWISPSVVFTGVESRSSSPVRIKRNTEMCSVSLDGLYPCGEGAGYAGGIVSSAVDGLKVAESIIKRYNLL